MKKHRTSFKKHKNVFIFLGIIFFFGVVSGIIFYLKQEPNVQQSILVNSQDIFSHNVFSIRNILIHLGIIFTVIVTSFLFLSPPLSLCIYFFEGVGVGFIIPILFSVFKWKFFLYFGLYFLFIKFIYLLLLGYVFDSQILFLKEYLQYIKTKKINFFLSLKRMFLFSFFLFLNDLFTFFISNRILLFILK